ncbi:MAG: DUF2784 domain-containing protein [Candidatus Sedimenticola sp. 20ELBAFRAG]
MIERIAADLVLLLHFGFILFVVLGGLLVLRWPKMAWLHVPCLAWGVIVDTMGWICPLTPLENRLRLAGGESGYTGGFIEHYLMPLVYPMGLTRGEQIGLAVAALLLNIGIYLYILKRNSN